LRRVNNMPKKRAGHLTADAVDIGGMFNEPGDVKHYGVARRKRVWKVRGNRKRLKRVLGLAAKLRKRGLSNSMALKKAWGKVKRKGYRNVTTAKKLRPRKKGKRVRRRAKAVWQ